MPRPAYTRNGDHGVHVDDGAQNTVVTDNVVGNAGTRGGIVVEGQLTAGTVVARNRVGISLNGTAIPNVGGGIAVTFHAVRTTIGPGNVVTNQADGIVIGPEADVDRNTITRNSIYGNSGLGIDVLPAGDQPERLLPRQRPEPGRAVPGDRERVPRPASPVAPAPAAPSRSSPPTAAPTRSVMARPSPAPPSPPPAARSRSR